MTKLITIGRTLNSNGEPIAGTGVELSSESPAAQLLFSQKNPVVFSNPVTREFGVAVNIKDEQGNTITKGLGIVPPGGSGPPLHIHPTYEEEFEVLEGSFDFILGKAVKRLHAGEKMVVPPGTAHTFRPKGDAASSFLVEARLPGKLNEVIHTVFGLAHDGKLDKKGRPGFLQGIIIGKELRRDTLFTSPPPFIQLAMFRLFGRMAQRRGYKAIYPQYMEDDFWKKRVEQLSVQGGQG